MLYKDNIGSNMKKSENVHRLIWLDLLKAIAMYAVVFYHLGKFSLSFEQNEMIAYISYFIRTILCIGVPLFFTVNGALVLSSNKPFELKKHVKKVIHIMIITFFWGIMVKAVLNKLDHVSFNFYDLLIASWSGEGLNYLWFMKSLITIYIFLPIIKAAFEYDKLKNAAGFIILLGVATFGNTAILRLVNSISFLINGTIFTEKFNFLNTYNEFQKFNAYPIVYFVLGGILIRNVDKLQKFSKKIYFSLIVFCMFFMTFYGIMMTRFSEGIYNIAGNSYNSLTALIIVISLFGIFANINVTNKYINNILAIIGQNTMGIYFLHIPIGYILTKYVTFTSAYKGNELYKIIFCVVVMALTLVISCLFRKIPLLNKMFHT